MAYQSKDFVRAVLSLCPDLVPNVDFEACDFGEGPVIGHWYRNDVAQPTQAEIEAVDTEAIPPPVPVSATPRQARLALLQAGLLDQAQAAVDAAGPAAKITWDYALEIRREDPLIVGIGVLLGITSEQIDNLFRTANTL